MEIVQSALAFLVAIVLIYVLIAVPLHSYVQPAIIMSAMATWKSTVAGV